MYSFNFKIYNNYIKYKWTLNLKLYKVSFLNYYYKIIIIIISIITIIYYYYNKDLRGLGDINLNSFNKEIIINIYMKISKYLILIKTINLHKIIIL